MINMLHAGKHDAWQVSSASMEGSSVRSLRCSLCSLGWGARVFLLEISSRLANQRQLHFSWSDARCGLVPNLGWHAIATSTNHSVSFGWVGPVACHLNELDLASNTRKLLEWIWTDYPLHQGTVYRSHLISKSRTGLCELEIGSS